MTVKLVKATTFRWPVSYKIACVQDYRLSIAVPRTRVVRKRSETLPSLTNTRFYHWIPSLSAMHKAVWERPKNWFHLRCPWRDKIVILLNPSMRDEYRSRMIGTDVHELLKATNNHNGNLNCTLAPLLQGRGVYAFLYRLLEFQIYSVLEDRFPNLYISN